MKSKDFMEARQELERRCLGVLADRGPQYAGPEKGGDRLANFKLIAELLGNFRVNPADPKVVLMVYMLKHICSVLSYLGGTPEGQEAIEGRLVDIRNYVDLLYALLDEGGRE
jgi:hypothetical protein